MFNNLNKFGLGKVVSVLIDKDKMSKYKMQIVDLLSVKERTISELQRALKISYKEAYRHISDLGKLGIVIREHKIKMKHQPVYLNLNPQFTRL